MNKRYLQGAAALAVWTAGSGAFASDHLDGPDTAQDPAADISDLYGWVDDGKIIAVLNVAPLAMATSKFSEAVQYALHFESSAAFGTPGVKTDVICTFDAAQEISCWVGAGADYVSGDASVETGITSKSSALRVFAGRRADPFFFNYRGFTDASERMMATMPSLTVDPAGCPAIAPAESSVLLQFLQSTSKGTKAAQNYFEQNNVLGIVLELQSTLVTAGGPTLALWASTHKAGG